MSTQDFISSSVESKDSNLLSGGEAYVPSDHETGSYNDESSEYIENSSRPILSVSVLRGDESEDMCEINRGSDDEGFLLKSRRGRKIKRNINSTYLYGDVANDGEEDESECPEEENEDLVRVLGYFDC